MFRYGRSLIYDQSNDVFIIRKLNLAENSLKYFNENANEYHVAAAPFQSGRLRLVNHFAKDHTRVVNIVTGSASDSVSHSRNKSG